jgi:hypothetical protein
MKTSNRPLPAWLPLAAFAASMAVAGAVAVPIVLQEPESKAESWLLPVSDLSAYSARINYLTKKIEQINNAARDTVNKKPAWQLAQYGYESSGYMIEQSCLTDERDQLVPYAKAKIKCHNENEGKQAYGPSNFEVGSGPLRITVKLSN